MSEASTANTVQSIPAPTYTRAQIRDLVLPLIERGAEHVPIVQLGDPVLRHIAQPFDAELDAAELDALIALMREVMHRAPGVGLAAPQIGVPLQLAVAEDHFPLSQEVAEARERRPLDFFAFLNPDYQPADERRVAFYEGCLSFNGYQAVVSRPHSVNLSYADPAGNPLSRSFAGWQARIIQHESDHLQGLIYVDLMEPRSITTNENFAKSWNQPTPADAAHSLGF